MAAIFLGDRAAKALSEGAACPSWGLNLNLLSPAPSPLLEAYRSLFRDDEPRKAVEQLLATGNVYFYKETALHLTVSSPAPFTSTKISREDTAAHEALAALWKRALEFAARNDPDWPRGPFAVTAESLVLEGRSAAFMSFRDDEGKIAALRRIIRRVAEEGCHWSDEESRRDGSAVLAANKELISRSGFKTPGIYHSTVLRFTADVTDEAEAEAIRASFAVLQKNWKPVTVQVEELLLVHERRPYMHEEGLFSAAMTSESISAVLKFEKQLAEKR